MAPTRAADDSFVWAPAPLLRLHWRDWGGDSVVFDEGSGLTHQLSPLAAAAMAWLESAPCTARELGDAIAGDLGTACDEALESALRVALQQLQDLGWIHPSSPR